jgi:nicotinate-nucleotide adenylyltransferase
LAALEGLVPGERIEAIRACRVQMPCIELSSSDIRRRVAAGLSIRYRTPRAVEKFIEAEGLYK